MTDPTIGELRDNFLAAKKALAEAQQYLSPQIVDNYCFDSPGQPVTLLDLFRQEPELFVIHNMGITCAYCTLWADGLNGVFQHLTNRASVVISSPDPVDVQQKFKAERGWQFNMVSTHGNTFTEDMGYKNEQGYHPGVSVFCKTEDTIHRVADTAFGPGDDFCAVWHLFDLLPGGASTWQPKLSY